MASLDESEKVVKEYWLKTHGGKIDNNDEAYIALKRWAIRKAFNLRRPVTSEMLVKHLNGAASATTPQSQTKSASKKDDVHKTSLAHVYKLFGKKDGRGKVTAEDKDTYTALCDWVQNQVSILDLGSQPRFLDGSRFSSSTLLFSNMAHFCFVLFTGEGQWKRADRAGGQRGVPAPDKSQGVRYPEADCDQSESGQC